MELMLICKLCRLCRLFICRQSVVVGHWLTGARVLRYFVLRDKLSLAACVICASENAMRTCFVYTTQSHFIFKVSATRYFFAQNEMELHSVGVFLL